MSPHFPPFRTLENVVSFVSKLNACSNDPCLTIVHARATMLLTNAETSDFHRAFLGKKARSITAAVLKVFWPSARGSLHHACCVLDYLLRSYADEVCKVVTVLAHLAQCATGRA